MVLILTSVHRHGPNMTEISNTGEADKHHGMGQFSAGVFVQIQNEPINGASKDLVVGDGESRIQTMITVQNRPEGISSASQKLPLLHGLLAQIRRQFH